MHHISTTPFGRRAVSAGLLATQALAAQDAPTTTADKYQILDNLKVARTAFGITDRELSVLAALLSFHQGRELSDEDPLIVYPSNRTLSERAFGMAESTLRRHLAALANAGLILRHDSPNGKRYAARDHTGKTVRAFGFSLRPLLVRASEIEETASQSRAQALHLRRVREDVVLMLRDASKLLAYAQDNGVATGNEALEDRLADIRRATRRRLSVAEITELHTRAVDLLSAVTRLHDPETEVLSGSDSQNERHYQNSIKDTYKVEESSDEKEQSEVIKQQPPQLPLHLVLKACPDIQPYARDRIVHWHQLIATVAHIRGMMGITKNAWENALQVMGHETAAITVAAILQRVDGIRSPGGYLRALTSQAETRGFSPGPMIMALLNAEGMKTA